MSLEVMKQALEALELTADRMQKQRDAITSLRQAIEQAEKQEPVAWSRASFIEDDDGRQIGTDEPELVWSKQPPDECGWSPLYPHPPAAQRAWVELTKDEIEQLNLTAATKSDVQDIQAKLKEKNT